jgi:hypothetical protein
LSSWSLEAEQPRALDVAVVEVGSTVMRSFRDRTIHDTT